MICDRLGKDTPSDTVDHIKPHNGDIGLFWNEDNWQALCASCHSGLKRSQEHHGHHNACGIDGMPIDAGHPWSNKKGA